MQKDDAWFASIKWSDSCLKCQSESGGVCSRRSCAESNYDPWGEEIPAYVYHPGGNTLDEYIERKRKKIESGEYIPTPKKAHNKQHIDTALTWTDLKLPVRLRLLVKHNFDVDTVEDFITQVPDISVVKTAFNTTMDKMLLIRLLKKLDEKGFRFDNCSSTKFPNIDTYILDEILSDIQVVSYGVSDEFVEYLKDEGCQNMADVLRLNPNKLTALTGELRLDAIDYLKAMYARGRLRLLAVPENTHPDWGKYIAETFAFSLPDLPFSTRLQNSFIKHGITTTAELILHSRKDLQIQKIAGDRGVAEIAKVLFNVRLHLSGDTFYRCEICNKKGVKQVDDSRTTLCKECAIKQKRIRKMKDVCVSISGPDYGSYTNLSSGFTLYANIENKTSNLMEITLTDFYVFSEGRQRAFLYYLNGYSFDTEHLFAHTSKTAGKIFPITGLKDGRLSVGDYVIIKIRTNSNEFRMFKFVYTDRILNTWRLDDYSEF